MQTEFKNNKLSAVLSTDLSSYLKNIEEEFENKAKSAIRYMLDDHFRDGRYSGKMGAGYMEIQNYLDAYFATEAMQKKLKETFEKQFAIVIREAMTKAMQHHANKAAFDPQVLDTIKQEINTQAGSIDATSFGQI